MSVLVVISIHAPREGSDRAERAIKDYIRAKFQSTLPARGATLRPDDADAHCGISIHAPREGERPFFISFSFGVLISIHAPARGATDALRVARSDGCNFNPRSPRGERRCTRWADPEEVKFQSTLPARGATVVIYKDVENAVLFQSTLPARGATRRQPSDIPRVEFQSTLPREGSDRV